MTPLLRSRTIVCLALGGALVLPPAAPASSTADRAEQSAREENAQHDRAARRGSLKVSPGLYVGGQRVTYSGKLNRTGRRHIHLQWHMARPGDTWRDVAGSGGRSRRDGSFRLSYISPSMFGIRVRVVGKGGAVSPARTLDPKSQELRLWANEPVRRNNAFSIMVDTTPDLDRRPDLPTPAFSGRLLRLQKRVQGAQWEAVATTRTDRQGRGTFTNVVWSTGDPVYRVRAENYTTNGNRIGWFPSYPTYLRTASGSRAAAPRASASTADVARADKRRPPANAATTFGWGRSLWDFAWEWGESLSSRPYRGTDRRGRWSDASNGSGRVAKHNGGLTLESQLEWSGPGDHGDTWATMRGNPMKYGRWETKVRINSPETDRRDYAVSIQLVPDSAPFDSCRTITIARVNPHGANVVVAANARENDRRWSYSKRIGSLVGGRSAAFAVDVSKRHISWFVNGRVIATLKNQAAVPDVPLTLQLSMTGAGQGVEMNRTAAIFDWQRGYSRARGRSPMNGHALTAGTHAPCSS